jgi:phage shock protein E
MQLFKRQFLPRLAMALVLLSIPIMVQADNSQPLWIDVRTASEFSGGHVEGALNIEFGDIVHGLAQRGIDSDTPIILYCGSGKRSGIAQQSLQSEGYSQVINAGSLQQALDLKGSQ